MENDEIAQKRLNNSAGVLLFRRYW